MTTAERELNLQGVSRRHETVRYDLYDQDGSRVGEVHPQRAGIQLSWDSGGTVSRRLRGLVFRPAEAADIDPFRHRLRPMWVLSTGDEFSLGRFLFVDGAYAESTRGRSLSATLLDESHRLAQTVPDSLGYPPSAEVDRAINDVLNRVGIRDRLVEASSTRVGDEGMVWAAGSGSWAKALDDLHAVGGYLPPYFDSNGRYIARPYEPPSDLSSELRYADVDGDPAYQRVHADSIERVPVPFDAPNVYLVIGGAESPIVGRYDFPASAPHSTYNRGYEVVSVEQKQGIASAATAHRRARQLATIDPDQAERLGFTATPEPRMDAYAVLEYNGDPYRVTSWTLDLSAGGAHTIHAIRLYQSTDTPIQTMPSATHNATARPGPVRMTVAVPTATPTRSTATPAAVAAVVTVIPPTVTTT